MIVGEFEESLIFSVVLRIYFGVFGDGDEE